MHLTDYTGDGENKQRAVTYAFSFIFAYLKCLVKNTGNVIYETQNSKIFLKQYASDSPSFKRLRRSIFSARSYSFIISRYAPSYKKKGFRIIFNF